MSTLGRAPSFVVLTTDDIAANTIMGSDLNSTWYAANSNIYIPVGNTASRPAAPFEGHFRRNNELNRWEGYDGANWNTVGGGATGGGTDDVFYENSANVTVNNTITAGKNAMTAGPITIDTGVTVTVPSGSVWTIV